MKIRSVSIFFRTLDHVLIPLMWILSGGKNDSIQESHLWHMQAFDPQEVPENIGIEIRGDDTSQFPNKSFGLLHVPLFGGWKKYVVLEAIGFSKYWHIGWKILYKNSSQKPLCQMQKLRIYSPYIKVLKGIPDGKRIFFGINEKGEFIRLQKIGESELGDGQFRDVRLF